MQTNKRSLLDPEMLLLLSGFFYYVAIPISMAADDEISKKALVLSLVGYAALTLGMIAIWLIPKRLTAVRVFRPIVKLGLWYSGTVVSLGGAISALALIMLIGGPRTFLMASYGERNIFSPEVVTLALLVNYWKFGLILEYCSIAIRRRLGFWMFFLVMGSILLLLFGTAWGRRTTVVGLLLGLMVVHHHFWRPISNRAIAAITVVLILVMVFMGQIRHSVGRESLAETLEFTREHMSILWFAPANIEFGAQFQVLSDLVRKCDYSDDFKLGYTYLSAWALLVPRLLWKDRPRAPAESYAAEADYDYYLSGGGYAYSLLGEGYENFGFIGSILMMFLIGAGTAQYSSWLKRSGWVARIIYANLAYAIPLLPRMDSATILKNVLLFEILGSLLILKLLTSLFALATSSRDTHRIKK